MSPKLAPVLALLLLGLASLISVPHAARAQTAQVSQKPFLTTLHNFDFTHGEYPVDSMTVGTDGFFYGTTRFGGMGDDQGLGTLYKISPQGEFTTLWRFNGKNGSFPSGSLSPAPDGSFWSITEYGGEGAQTGKAFSGNGTVFRLAPDGTLTTVHNFHAASPDGPNIGGAFPSGGLLRASDGNFYGTTERGGKYGLGVIFSITPEGAFSVVHDYKMQDGSRTMAVLTEGADSVLYGTTTEAGTHNCGTIFRVRPGVDFHVLRSFTRDDGSYTSTPLVFGPDGTLYGMTHLRSYRGDDGTAYKLTPSGVFSVIHRFHYDRYHDYAPSSLLLGPDGLLYGTLDNDGDGGTGTVFRMTSDGKVTTLYQFHSVPGTEYPDIVFPHGFCPSSVVFGMDGVLYGTTLNGVGTGYGGYGTIFKLTLPQ